ncbi:hypothetical protein Q5692_16375 [Microcoleus sp. C2C3]
MSQNRQDAFSTKQGKVRSILVLFERTFAMRQGIHSLSDCRIYQQYRYCI